MSASQEDGEFARLSSPNTALSMDAEAARWGTGGLVHSPDSHGGPTRAANTARLPLLKERVASRTRTRLTGKWVEREAAASRSTEHRAEPSRSHARTPEA
ncbi:unnamed protein product [Lampetra planeri]